MRWIRNAIATLTFLAFAVVGLAVVLRPYLPLLIVITFLAAVFASMSRGPTR